MAEDYTYIVARLRALEAAMPERGWFERLARTPLASLMGALREYYPSFEGLSDLADFEQALEAEKASMLDLVASLLSEGRSKMFVRGGYDFDNVTHAWKAAKLGAKTALTPFGLVLPSSIEQTVAGKARGIIPPHLERHIEMLEVAYETSKSLAATEYAAEAAKWRFLFDMAPGEEAASYLRGAIDLINIESFIRLRRSGARREALETVWIEGGGIETARFRSLYREAEEEFFSFLATSDHRNLLAFGLAKDIPLAKADLVIRRGLTEMLGASRYRHFDFSPVLYHIELRERDYRILRGVIVGALNGMSEETRLEHVNALLPS